MMTSHPSRSYTLETSRARPTPFVPSTAIIRTLCVATVISRPRARARFLVLCCRRRRRSALPRRLRLRTNIFLLSTTCSIFSLSLSPYLPCILFSRHGFTRPTPRRPAYLPSPGRIWCLLTGSSPPSRFPRRYASFGVMTVGYERSDLWIQLAVHRRCHRPCRYIHRTPGFLTVSSLTSTVWVYPGREAAGASKEHVVIMSAKPTVILLLFKEKPERV